MVKICGVCRPEDAAAAASAGADFVGVILAPNRRRSQTEQTAAGIFAQAASLRRVGVFADQPVATVARIAESLQLDVIQLHGAEEPRAVAQLAADVHRTIWKAVSVRSGLDIRHEIDLYGQHVQGLLLDTRHGGLMGGSGATFDWQLATDARSVLPPHLALIVAGGLTPENVGAAIAWLDPDVVDVASGVERVAGEKSPAAIAAFVRNAKL